MYSVSKRVVRISSGIASLKEVQDMRMHTELSLVLARTLSAHYEGYGRMLPLCQAKPRAYELAWHPLICILIPILQTA